MRKLLLALAALTIAPVLLLAGTLVEAPFRVVVPSKEWKVDDAAAQPMGNDVFLVATVSHTNGVWKSVVIKTALKKTSDTTLEELSAGIRDSFSNPAVKKIAETNATFLGFKAKTFTCQVTQGDQVIYNEATVFVAGKVGWTIAVTGPMAQKEAIKKIMTFYQKKP